MSGLTGTGQLFRLALRLDRARLPVWIGALTLVVLATAASFAGLYPDVASRVRLAAGLTANPSLLALYGPMYAPETIGGLAVWRQGSFVLVLVALLSLLTVVRHSRAEEESGRLELVGATVVGRRAPLAAALLTAIVAATAIGLAVAVGLIALGEDAAGSFAFGAGVTGVGWCFAGVAAVTSQITDDAGTARALAGAALGAAFGLRAVGDASADGVLDWLAWLSPLGWAQRIRPYAEERWWVLGLLLAFALVTIVVADRMLARRDIGSGLLRVRPGPARAAGYLGRPVGLAWRLQRATLGWWLGIVLVMGALFGSLAETLTRLVTDNPQMAAILERLGGSGRIIDAFLGAIMAVFATLVSVYAVGATLQLRHEETESHAEMVLATAVHRWSWAAGHLLFAFVAPAVLLLAAGASAGLTSGITTGEGAGNIGRVAAAGVAHLPAVWVIAAIAMFAVGIAPRLTALAYGALAVFVLLGQVGEALELDQAVLNVSPFVHTPQLPAATLTWTPLLWLTAVALVLIAVGMAGLRRRDIPV